MSGIDNCKFFFNAGFHKAVEALTVLHRIDGGASVGFWIPETYIEAAFICSFRRDVFFCAGFEVFVNSAMKVIDQFID